MVLRFLPRYVFVVVLQAVTFPLAVVLCLFVVYREESAVTGYPSQFPGTKRAFLWRPFRLFQSFDDCLDAYWYSGRAAWMGFDQAYYDAHWWLRYVCNVLWLWRNPAYGWARLVGFEQTNLFYVFQRDESEQWGKTNNLSWRVARNAANQYGFLLEGQWFFCRRRCFEVVLGWKIPWLGDPTNKAMLATRINPLKSYPAA